MRIALKAVVIRKNTRRDGLCLSECFLSNTNNSNSKGTVEYSTAGRKVLLLMREE